MKHYIITTLKIIWAIFSFMLKVFLISIFGETKEEKKPHKESEEQDIQDYKNRVGKFSNDVRWYDN